MNLELADVCCARVDTACLAALAGLRCEADIEVIPQGNRVWLRWTPGNARVLQQLMPLPGVELFTRKQEEWFRFGNRLPGEGPPSTSETQRLDKWIVPAPVATLQSPPFVHERVRHRLVATEMHSPATALLCPLSVLAHWSKSATTRQIEVLEAAHAGQRVALRGRPLPWLRDATRFWGRRILIPLGYSLEPALPDSAWCDVLGLEDGAVAFMMDQGVEILPGDAFGPLHRAGIRLAKQGSPP